MNMKHGLSGALVAIHHYSIPLVSKSLLARQFRRDQVKFTDQAAVILPNVVNRRNMLARNNQDMRRRLWIDVPKGDN